MSPQNSDPLFDSVEFGGPLNSPVDAPVAVPIPVQSAATQYHGFTIYTVLLIISFLMLTTAAILFFMDAGKY